MALPLRGGYAWSGSPLLFSRANHDPISREPEIVLIFSDEYTWGVLRSFPSARLVLSERAFQVSNKHPERVMSEMRFTL
eukprot:1331145-Amorphochlora_amoeboformis.AAC.1